MSDDALKFMKGKDLRETVTNIMRYSRENGVDNETIDAALVALGFNTGSGLHCPNCGADYEYWTKDDKRDEYECRIFRCSKEPYGWIPVLTDKEVIHCLQIELENAKTPG